MSWDLIADLRDEAPSEGVYAAVLATLYEVDGVVRLLLTKRPMHMPTHKGHLAFPGGKPHPEDDGVVGTALREAEEEVGIPPSAVEILGFLEPIHTVEYTRYVVPVVGRVRTRPRLVLDPGEVDLVLEPPLDELADPGSWWFEEWQDRHVWFRDVEDEVLWGATATMTRRLLGLPERAPEGAVPAGRWDR
jgi:8-oxo-dGTP pyrophosphatase MutT (NUDIX family)